VEVDGSRLEVFGPVVALAELANANGGEDIIAKMKRVAAAASTCEHAMFGMQVASRYLPETLQLVVRDYPAGFSQWYFESGMVMHDPTVAHCQRTMEALVWTPQMYTPESMPLYEEARAAGLEYGISVAYHESGEVKSMISFARDRPFDERELKYHVALAHTTIACAHLAAKRTAIPQLVESLRGKLTPREQWCMELLCEGKSNSVMAQLMGISEATVEFHLRNLYDKLKVTTRYQAMAAGLQLLQGYVPPERPES
jgi:LuxR family quorum-sensing transcriptional regulator LasR